MAKPAELALAEESEDGWQSRLLKYVGVRDLVLPLNPQDTSKAAEVKAVEASLLCSIGCPTVTGVEKCGEDAGSVYLGVCCMVVVGPHSLVEFGHHCRSLGDPGADLRFKRKV